MRFTLVLLGFVVIILMQLFDGIVSDSENEEDDDIVVSSTKAPSPVKDKNQSHGAPKKCSSASKGHKRRTSGKNGVKQKTTKSPEVNNTADTPTRQPLKPWGPTDRGNYTIEGIYIEVMKMPMTCNRTSQKGDYLTTDYLGTFPNGEKFDSTYDRKQPVKYKLGQGEVIQGCEIGTTRMCAGETRRVIIPPKYAYGDKEHGGIPPGSTLHFEITLTELLEDPFAIFDKMMFGHQ